MKLLSLNIEGDKHLSARIFPLLERERADVLCLQEVFLQDLQSIAKVAALPNYTFVPLGKVIKPNPHLPAHGDWGMAIFAPALSNIQQHYYVGQPDSLPEFFANGNPNAMNRVLLSAIVTVDEQQFTVVTTHFTWSGKGEVSDLQRQSFLQLKKYLAQYTDLILCGDLNTPRGGEIYDELARLYQDNIPANIDTTIDSHLHKSGLDIRLVVDGLFTSPTYIASQVRVLPAVSDHMAVVAEIDRREAIA